MISEQLVSLIDGGSTEGIPTIVSHDCQFTLLYIVWLFHSCWTNALLQYFLIFFLDLSFSANTINDDKEKNETTKPTWEI